MCQFTPAPSEVYLTWPAQFADWLVFILVLGLAFYLMRIVYHLYRTGQFRGDTRWVLATRLGVSMAVALCVEAIFEFAVIHPVQVRLWAWWVRESSLAPAPSCFEAYYATWQRESAWVNTVQNITTVLLLVTLVVAAVAWRWLLNISRATPPIPPTVDPA